MRTETTPVTQIVQSVSDFAIREINAAELLIVEDEDKADARLWDQARQVVELLDTGFSQRQLAAQWINARTGKPYDKSHVGFVKQAFLASQLASPRPRFRDAYNAIANAGSPHVSHNSGNCEWYTPAEYIEAARSVLGAIDLDPASCESANTIVQATTYYTLQQNGLAQSWRGRVWMNPPYGKDVIEPFTAKFADAVIARKITAGIVLVNNATETDWFSRLSGVATAICFPKGRVRFWSPELGTATPLQGQAVLYAGDRLAAFRDAFESFGRCW